MPRNVTARNVRGSRPRSRSEDDDVTCKVTQETTSRTRVRARHATTAQFADMAEPGEVQAWEEIDVGRYMPRRIRGSCRGRALG